MNYFNNLYLAGCERVKEKRITIFGMVRDCGKALRRNIPTVEAIATYFADYRIVVLENNSKDNTKEVLRTWQRDNNKVTTLINDFDESKYKQILFDERYYKYFQLNKLQKYYDYRNQLKEYVDSLDFDSDYSMLIDLDVIRIDVKGVITSFGTDINWDAVTANGYSFAPSMKRRFHDTFALCEYGMEDKKQTLQMVRDYQSIFGFLRKGMPFIRVFSSYGGIAIYRTEAIKGLKYVPAMNEYGQVQVRCEHFALFQAMAERGYDKVFINPNMEVFYQEVSVSLIKKKIKELVGILYRKKTINILFLWREI